MQVRAKGDGPVVFGTDVVNLSDLLFRLFGYPIIRVRNRTGDDESPMVRLSFRDLFKFCYLEQEELDSSFFRLNTPVLAEKSKDSLNFFTGYYSEVLSTLQTAYDQTRSDQRAKRDAAERIREFLREFDFASAGQISAELEKIRNLALHGAAGGSAARLSCNDITVAAMLKCPLRRKVEMSLWIRLQPFRNTTRGISTGAEPSPRPDRLGRVAREGRGRVKGTPSALAFSVSFIAFLVDVAGSCMCRARISRCFRKSG